MEARWHPVSEQKAAAHSITWAEVEQALEPPIVVERTSAPGTQRVLGVSYEGRRLAIFIAPDRDAPTVYVITARDMDDRERQTYRRRKDKG